MAIPEKRLRKRFPFWIRRSHMQLTFDPPDPQVQQALQTDSGSSEEAARSKVPRTSDQRTATAGRAASGVLALTPYLTSCPAPAINGDDAPPCFCDPGCRCGRTCGCPPNETHNCLCTSMDQKSLPKGSSRLKYLNSLKKSIGKGKTKVFGRGAIKNALGTESEPPQQKQQKDKVTPPASDDPAKDHAQDQEEPSTSSTLPPNGSESAQNDGQRDREEQQKRSCTSSAAMQTNASPVAPTASTNVSRRSSLVTTKHESPPTSQSSVSDHEAKGKARAYYAVKRKLPYQNEPRMTLAPWNHNGSTTLADLLTADLAPSNNLRKPNATNAPDDLPSGRAVVSFYSEAGSQYSEDDASRLNKGVVPSSDPTPLPPPPGPPPNKPLPKPPNGGPPGGGSGGGSRAASSRGAVEDPRLRGGEVCSSAGTMPRSQIPVHKSGLAGKLRRVASSIPLRPGYACLGESIKGPEPIRSSLDTQCSTKALFQKPVDSEQDSHHSPGSKASPMHHGSIRHVPTDDAASSPVNLPGLTLNHGPGANEQSTPKTNWGIDAQAAIFGSINGRTPASGFMYGTPEVSIHMDGSARRSEANTARNAAETTLRHADCSTGLPSFGDRLEVGAQRRGRKLSCGYPEQCESATAALTDPHSAQAQHVLVDHRGTHGNNNKSRWHSISNGLVLFGWSTKRLEKKCTRGPIPAFGVAYVTRSRHRAREAARPGCKRRE
ncbi:uncharacterized protein E0L32_009822 [Thyridium curvatum]|uniref:Uncharacterized protein n=1 Tax=Thyridium curvatum TaxID=1093900 RepID=A0A507AWW1_9PEZI|nr:uncharacterized protein E0L32_009822 [Thyridium curvatum]TPX08760.1 hypothetical protein E0L32_009822 [Thyridium curvatum]